MVVGFSLWIVPRKKVGEKEARKIAGKFGEVLDVTLQERGVLVTFTTVSYTHLTLPTNREV